MILFHYTSRSHLEKILAAGFLTTGNPMISSPSAGLEYGITGGDLTANAPNNGHPEVVWLTTKDEPFSAGHGLDGAAVDKRAVRFAVDVPKREILKWREWAQSRGINKAWFEAVTAAGGSYSWRVVARPITSSEWVSVTDTATGSPIEG